MNNSIKCYKDTRSYNILQYRFSDSDVVNLRILNNIIAISNIPVYNSYLLSSTVSNNALITTLLDKNEGLFIDESIKCYSTNVMTVSFWFFSTLLQSKYHFLFTLQDNLGYPSGKRFFISITPQNKLTVNEQYSSQQVLLINKWYHIVCTVNTRNELILYINNQIGKGTVTYPSFINVRGKNRIGNDPATNGCGLIGKITKFELTFNYLSKQDVDTRFLQGF